MKIYFIDNKLTTLYSELKNSFNYFNEVYIAVAFLKKTGFDALFYEISHHLKTGTIKIISGIDFYYSDAEAFEFCLLNKIPLKLYIPKDDFSGNFHPKLYIFKRGHEVKVICGSSNFSFSAMEKNKEFSTVLRGTLKNKKIKSCLNYFNSLWESQNASPLTQEVIDGYKQKKLVGKEEKIFFLEYIKKQVNMPLSQIINYALYFLNSAIKDALFSEMTLLGNFPDKNENKTSLYKFMYFAVYYFKRTDCFNALKGGYYSVKEEKKNVLKSELSYIKDNIQSLLKLSREAFNFYSDIKDGIIIKNRPFFLNELIKTKLIKVRPVKDGFSITKTQ